MNTEIVCYQAWPEELHPAGLLLYLVGCSCLVMTEHETWKQLFQVVVSCFGHTFRRFSSNLLQGEWFFPHYLTCHVITRFNNRPDLRTFFLQECRTALKSYKASAEVSMCKQTLTTTLQHQVFTWQIPTSKAVSRTWLDNTYHTTTLYIKIQKKSDQHTVLFLLSTILFLPYF